MKAIRDPRQVLLSQAGHAQVGENGPDRPLAVAKGPLTGPPQGTPSIGSDDEVIPPTGSQDAAIRLLATTQEGLVEGDGQKGGVAGGDEKPLAPRVTRPPLQTSEGSKSLVPHKTGALHETCQSFRVPSGAVGDQDLIGELVKNLYGACDQWSAS